MKRIRILLLAVLCTVLLPAADMAAADIMNWSELEMALHQHNHSKTSTGIYGGGQTPILVSRI